METVIELSSRVYSAIVRYWAFRVTSHVFRLEVKKRVVGKL